MSTNINITVTDRFGRRCASSDSNWEPILGYSLADQTRRSLAPEKASAPKSGVRLLLFARAFR